MSAQRLFALLRLGSPALPIGGFSYSQGLESAIELGWAGDEDGVQRWIEAVLEAGVGRFEAPLCRSLFGAMACDDWPEADALARRYLVSRETAELRAETLQMGQSLVQMVMTLPEISPVLRERAAQARSRSDLCPLPWGWGLAARVFQLDPDAALIAWLWAWAENQVMAAMKAVPLGQQAGQRLLSALGPRLEQVAQQAATLPAECWSSFTPGLAIASSRHETQYSRLFRS
jgi:urease accessory protein